MNQPLIRKKGKCGCGFSANVRGILVSPGSLPHVLLTLVLLRLMRGDGLANLDSENPGGSIGHCVTLERKPFKLSYPQILHL